MKRFPLEAHFVHFSCAYNSLSEALTDYEKNADIEVVGVVSILFEVSRQHNPAFDALFGDRKLFSEIKYPDNLDTVNVSGSAYIENLDLRNLIPSNIRTAGYYAYEGSLTTPPCTDVLRWYVMNARGYISEQQLHKFRQLLNSPDLEGEEDPIAR